MDRIAPTRRPEGPNAGTQRWRDLLFLHWEVPAKALRPLVPAALDLDLHDGVAYVGLVPFAMEGVRPRFLPRGTGLSFLETNVRTYVSFRGGAPGVYFFSLEAASWLAVQVARAQWGLPYFHARMTRHITQTSGGETRIDYHSVRRGGGPRLDVSWTVDAPLGPAAPDTIEHFLLERYYLYVARSGHLYRGQVHHPPYPAAAADVHHVKDELVGAAGLPSVSSTPVFAHCSAGVDVEVFTPVRVA